jgi:CheY-like chemotaxis protein
MVLVIDDHVATCQFIQHLCKALNHECLTAYTGQDGLALLEQYRPALLLLDLLLPGGISGWDIIAHVKHQPQLHPCTIITISASDHRDRAAQLGSDEFLRKPFTVQQLTHVLQKYHNPAN